MESEKFNILYVDDEEDNLRIFKASFRREFNVFTAVNTSIAKEILQSNDIQLIISDQRMPDKTGVEFLEETIADFPDVIRIILTAFSDTTDIIRAVNKVGIYRYLTKPWDIDDLMMTIKSAVNNFGLKRQNKNLIVNLQQINEELLHANEDLKKRNQELDEYVYRISHEVRAPISSIMGLFYLLKNHEDHDNLAITQTYLKLIEESISKLDIFIRSVLQYSATKNFEQQIEEIDFHKVIEDCLDEFFPQGTSGKIKISKEIHAEVTFFSDVSLLMTIFRNLLENAIKYAKPNEQNSISVLVKTDENKVSIRFADEGIGIPFLYQEKVFDMFYRGNDEANGSGLGLYIVKMALSKLNGSIRLESEENVGTTFFLEIPNSKA
ncbi:MAG: hybrid sensor histidine kinase/response regulator [Cytophagales bacterium]|nr:MAG: hybrid sensor histidine kinase/response regulator [Cytophagales bacterium]